MKFLYHIEGKSGGSKEPNKGGNILDRIEEVRERLHSIITRNMIFDNEVIKLSQQLDKLIIDHFKSSELDSNEEKRQK